MCGGQRATLWSQFYPFTCMWVLGVEMSSPGLCGKYLYPLSHYATSFKISSVCVCVPVCMHVCMCVMASLWKQRITFRSQFTPFPLLWVPGIELRSQALEAGTLTH